MPCRAKNLPPSRPCLKQEQTLANGTQHYGESKECVAAVKWFCGAPQTLHWIKGVQVKGNHSILPGTAIATFTAANGGYQGHAAICVKQDSRALYVLDQWGGIRERKFSPRPIYFDSTRGVSNDGNQFYVVD